ncbi:hypothetical protein KCP77_03610 [Salmonella enterica subsp. enterica]|nr:hypothetical protein KCP77_03610 [Salmonella enterica subsp. enterica]
MLWMPYACAGCHASAKPGNLGGGGFMLLRTKDGATTATDFREWRCRRDP